MVYEYIKDKNFEIVDIYTVSNTKGFDKNIKIQCETAHW